MHNDLITIGKFTLHGYSAMIAIGFIIAMGLCILKAKKQHKSEDVITDLGLICCVGGFLGGKILYLIVDYKTLFANPKAVLGFPQIFSGFVVYGGIISGFIGVLIYAKIKKIRAFEYLDFMLPFIAIVQGFGRIGCFLAGCCYGAPESAFSSYPAFMQKIISAICVVFPEGGIAPAGIKLFPSQLFSAGGDFVIAGILLLFSMKNKKEGNVSLLYVILYGIGRFFIEFFRSDERGTVGVFSTSQFIAFIMVPVAILLMVILNFYKKDKEEKKVEEVKAEKVEVEEEIVEKEEN